ncbi:MAG: hypothetical protein FJX71_03025, partial [Alphaproteobacteria bacterium]|nr:hypothetical protein [Alphaproteobacteria bacterium]
MLSNKLIKPVARVVLAAYMTHLIAPIAWACEGGVETLLPGDPLAQERLMGRGHSSSFVPKSSLPTYGPEPSSLINKERLKAQALEFQYHLHIKTNETPEKQLKLKLSRRAKGTEDSFEKLHTLKVTHGKISSSESKERKHDDDILKSLFKEALFVKERGGFIFSLGSAILKIASSGFVLLEDTASFLSPYDLVLKTSKDLLLPSLNVASLTLDVPTAHFGFVSTRLLHLPYASQKVLNKGGLRVHQATGLGTLINHGQVHWEGTKERPATLGLRQLINSSSKARMEGMSLHITKDNQTFINGSDAEVSLGDLRVDAAHSPLINKGILRLHRGTIDREVINKNLATITILDQLLVSNLFNAGDLTVKKQLKILNGKNTASIIIDHFWMPEGNFENDGKLTTSSFHLEKGTFHNLPKGSLTVLKTTKVDYAHLHNEGKMVTGLPKAPGHYTQSYGEFRNTGVWDHTGDVDLGRTKFSNESEGTLIWQKGRWDTYGLGLQYNYGVWTIDQMYMPRSSRAQGVLNISNYGTLHLKSGELTFGELTNHGILMFGGGRYTILSYLLNDHIMKFLNHDWTITDSQSSRAPNRIVLVYPDRNVYNTTQKNAFLKPVEIKKTLFWDLQDLPVHLHTEGDIVFSERHRKARRLDDLANIATPGKVTFYVQSVNTSRNFEFSNIGHLVLYAWYFGTTRKFIVPALTLCVEGPLTCGESNDKMGTISATRGPLSVTAREIDSRFGTFNGEVGPVHLKATRDNILIGAPLEITKGSPFTYGESPETGPYKWKQKNGASVVSGGPLILETPGKILVDYGDLLSGGEQLLKSDQLIRNQASSFTSLDKVIIRSPEYEHTRAPKISNSPPQDALYIIIPEVPGSDPATIEARGNIEIHTQKTTNVASKMRSGEDILINGIKLDEKIVDLSQKIPGYVEEAQNLYEKTWTYQYYWVAGCVIRWLLSTPLFSTETCSLIAKKDIHINTGGFLIKGRIGARGAWIHGSGNGKFDGTSFVGHATSKGDVLFNLTQSILEKTSASGALKKNTHGEIVPPIRLGAPRVSIKDNYAMFLDDKNQHLYRISLNPATIRNPLRNLSSGLFELFLNSAVADLTGRIDFEGSRELEEHTKRFSHQTKISLLTQDHLHQASTMLLLNSLQQVGESIEEHMMLFIPAQAITTTRGISAKTIDASQDGDLTTENYELEAEEDVSLVAAKRNLLLTTPRRIILGHVTRDVVDTQATVKAKKGRARVQGGEHVGIKGAVVEGDQDLLVRSEGDIAIEDVALYRSETYQTVKDGGLFGGDTVTHTHVESSTPLPAGVKSLHGNVRLETMREKSISIIGSHFSAPEKDILLEGGEITAKAGIGGTTVATTIHTRGAFSSSRSSSSTHTATFIPTTFEARNIHVNAKKSTFTGADFVAQILYDNSATGAHFKPAIGVSTYFTQTIGKTPLSSTDVGCQGWYEVMQPCRFAINQIIRKIDDGELILESVQWDSNRTQIIGKFVETTYQLKQWQTSWATRTQVVPDEALVVAAFAISLATQGWGTALGNTLLGSGTMSAQMAST